MADSIMSTGSEVSVLIPSIWSSNFYDALLAELPFNSIISRDWEGEIQALGDTVKISQVPEFDAASDLSESSRNDASAVTVTQQSLTINKRFVKDFVLTNKAILQSIPLMNKLRDLAIYSIMKKMQTHIISLIVPSASAPDHTLAFTSGTTLDIAKLLDAKELLDNQDVPMSDRHLVLGAEQLNDLFAISTIQSSDFVASNTPVLSGQLPSQIFGFQPHFTSEVGDVVYLFHSSFMTMAVQQGMSVKQYDLGVDGFRGERVNCDVLAGFKQMDNLRVVTIG